jgi:hypothetical protein
VISLHTALCSDMQNTSMESHKVVYHSYFVFRRSWVQILAWRLAILTDVFLQIIPCMITSLHVLSNSLIILLFDVI